MIQKSSKSDPGDPPWEVKKQSYKKGNALLGIYVHNIKNQNSETDIKGKNPFDSWHIKDVYFSSIYKSYDWVHDEGRDNISKWIEEAIKLNNDFRKT